MAEIGSRYQELYWAGKDENWDYHLSDRKNETIHRKWTGKKTQKNKISRTVFKIYFT